MDGAARMPASRTSSIVPPPVILSLVRGYSAAGAGIAAHFRLTTFVHGSTGYRGGTNGHPSIAADDQTRLRSLSCTVWPSPWDNQRPLGSATVALLPRKQFPSGEHARPT